MVMAIAFVGMSSFELPKSFGHAAVADTTAPAKLYKVELPIDQWGQHIQRLNGIRTYAQKSNLPHQDVIFIDSSMTVLLNDVINQLNKQLIPADTAKHKK